MEGPRKSWRGVCGGSNLPSFLMFLVSNPGNGCGESQRGCRGEIYRVSNTERIGITDLKELARG